MSREERRRSQEEERTRSELLLEAMCTHPQTEPGWLMSFDIQPTFTPWEIWHFYEREQGIWLRNQRVTDHHRMEIAVESRPLSPTETAEFVQQRANLLAASPPAYTLQDHARDSVQYCLSLPDRTFSWELPRTGLQHVWALGEWIAGLPKAAR